MKRLFQWIGFIYLLSVLTNCISFAAAYTPGAVNNTYSLNFSKDQYGINTVMTDKPGGGWKTDAGYGTWHFYSGYDVGGYIYHDDNYGDKKTTIRGSIPYGDRPSR